MPIASRQGIDCPRNIVIIIIVFIVIVIIVIIIVIAVSSSIVIFCIAICYKEISSSFGR